MSVNLFKIKKWTNMILGHSSYHVNQKEGTCYSIAEIKGYYNDLTEKITRFGRRDNEVPITRHDNGIEEYFSIAIFQYGLAAYDLWLLTKEGHYIDKFKSCLKWALDNQQENGSWITFQSQNPDEPYSAMAQGEGISLLTRAYKEFGDQLYLERSQNAFDFLVTPRSRGGVCDISEDTLELYEYTYLPLVLNGWIFSSWGILDYYKASGNTKSKEYWHKTVNTIVKRLPDFDNGYWSKYNTDKNLTSPFYHRLHIAQLKAMHQLTGIEEFEAYSQRWEKQLRNPLIRAYSFVVKSIQKILE